MLNLMGVFSLVFEVKYFIAFRNKYHYTYMVKILRLWKI